MDRIESKWVGIFLPAFTDELVHGEPSESLQTFGNIAGGDEIPEVCAQLVVAVVVVPLDGGLLMVLFMRSTCPFVQGWFGSVRPRLLQSCH
jgi:hypothetical protein